MLRSPLILFDGECNLCNRAVQFIVKRDKKAFYRFASLQSSVGRSLMQQYAIPLDYSSIVLIENGKAYLKSTAALRVARHLTGFWPLLSLFLAIPRPIRNQVYDIVARNRYKWFGKTMHCMVAHPQIQNRFLS
ncbi:hypothetical protein A8C56_10225 [Niabella ginsenosidivorans]|uniref:Thiol-disulfide oxidoreductase n=1 Tax=Niabella ginsenosidivorans TaxID=1176587 RepID=A0A1A9I2L6_9BACT|nr:DCC1-like thiol-disulfide oxidoreductase family protein [Niabella ginsenosidivorans]ANH81309.1 hypothetical protein A8C56_10225 [Niabella ginsenosidivorans]